MSTSTLYERPDLYDLVAPADPAMERFYVGLAREPGGRVLELACGTGRIAIPLARAGLHVVGADLSRDMLTRARTAADAAGVALALERLDMRGFALPGQLFDTIIIAANSLLHLHSAEDFRGFLTSVRNHLKPGGRLAFDVFVPSMSLLSLDPDQRQLVGRFDHGELGEVTLEETIHYDPVSQVSEADWYWSAAGRQDFWHSPLKLRQIFPQELPLLVAAGGMRLSERFGDFDRSPLTAGSRRQVCICEA